MYFDTDKLARRVLLNLALCYIIIMFVVAIGAPDNDIPGRIVLAATIATVLEYAVDYFVDKWQDYKRL